MQDTADPVARLAAAIDRRGIGAFLALAFGLAWAMEGTALALGHRFTSPTLGNSLLLAAVMLTPGIAAFIGRRFIIREGFATGGLRFGPWRAYLALWLGIPVFIAAIYALTALCGFGRFDPSFNVLAVRIHEAAQGREIPALPPMPVLGAVVFAQSMTLGLVVTTLFTFGEEFGWTGYLLLKLLPLGRWRAALIYGVIWGLWHAPLIAGGHNYPDYPVVGVVLMCALTTAFALTQTALRLRYGSVIVTSFFHAIINNQGAVLPLVVVGVSPVLGGITGIVGIVSFAALGAWLLWRTPEREAGGNPGSAPARRPSWSRG